MDGHEAESVLVAVEKAAARLWADVVPGPALLSVRCGDIEVRLESAVRSAVVAPPIAAEMVTVAENRNGTAPLTAAAAVPPRLPAPAAPSWGTRAIQAAGTRPVCAPLIGVFYRAPAPDEPPFVEVGDSIRVGQQIGIIEAMKTMVPVESDVAGRVTDILADTGEPVEFGCPLLAVAGD